MARIRSIKPAATKSRTLTSWPREVRLAWHYLSTYLDDAGRGHDNLRSILGECFSEDPDVSERKLEGWLAMMAQPPAKNPAAPAALCRYEVDGARYLHDPTFRRHQKINRPQESRLPACPTHGADSE